MSRVAYVNGAYRPLASASVSIEDRGFQFADAVYEVWAVRDGRLLDVEGHVTRLRRSSGEIGMLVPMTDAALLAVVNETVRRNRVRDGLAYLQISRGAAPRDHAFPNPPTRQSVIVTAKSADMKAMEARARAGIAVVSAPDLRWRRCDIKSVSLLPNVLAKQAAREAGAFEAWLVDEAGQVTEGTSSNAWIVDGDGRLRTPPLSANILAGVTRATLIRLAGELQIPLIEQAFTVAEAHAAREAFISSASAGALAVISIDGIKIGAGAPGPIVRRLRDAYFGAQDEAS